MTDLAVFKVAQDGSGLARVELAPGATLDIVQDKTGVTFRSEISA